MSIRLRYTIALSLIALLVTSSAFYLQSIFEQQESDGLIINTAGQQRMLSQRIALFVHRVAAEGSSPEERKMLEASVSHFSQNHLYLTSTPTLPESVSSLYYGDAALHERVQQYIASAKQFVDADGSTTLTDMFRPTSVNGLLRDLNEVVKAFENDANERVERSKQVETMIWLFTLFVLVLEIVFIFRPMELSIKTKIAALIQEREKAETAQQKAVEASKAKSEFLASMSHELRTPMNGIFGMMELATDNPNKAPEYMLKAKNAGKQLLVLINDLLDFSKIESGKIDLESTSFDLMQMIDEVVSVQDVNSRSKGLEFVFEKASPLPAQVISDPTRIAQILHNLLNNAVKFTQKGSVKLSVAVEIKDKRPWFLMRVKDTGIGIPENKLEHIFEKFTQADQSTTRAFGGTGLGLSITRSLTTLLGGSIDVDSQPGKGSTFSVNFPIEIDKTRSELDPDEVISDVSCAIVDDLGTSCEYLSNLASNLGLQSACFQSPQLFLERSEDYDILLLDYAMPELDGIEVLRQIVQRTDRKPPFIMFISAAHEQLDIPDELAQYVWRIHPKPVLRKELEYDLLHLKKMCSEAANHGIPEEIRHVLVVEDNEINAEIARTMLESAGYQVIWAGNGEKAVTVCTQNQFDLIFMDMNMPVMDGITATGILREKLRLTTPIIAFTANAFKGDEAACIEAGMNDFITKPINKAELLDKAAVWTKKDDKAARNMA